MANPASSGTAYTAIASLVQVMGEAKAFEYLQARCTRTSNQYTKSGVAPVKAVARGETLVERRASSTTWSPRRWPASRWSATPCEGTGYEIGSMSIVEGARNPTARSGS